MRPIRRKDRALPEAAARDILEQGAYGFLATVGADGAPYGVPLSYVVLDGGIYFHCAHDGRKTDNLRHCRQVSFTVVGKVAPVFDTNFSTCYESAMAFGSVGEVTDAEEKFRVLHALSEKYLPEHLDKAEDAIRASFARTAVYRMTIAAITGKAKRPRPG